MVTLAVYIYFFVSLIGEQSVIEEEEKLDIYYPIFMTVKFLFYFGWLRVAETLYVRSYHNIIIIMYLLKV